jgi:Right handed beta helix region
MTKASLFIATLFALSLHVAPAQAQLSRTHVSAASGNDANDCNRATPCRTFQGAHDKTNADGEITVLDPGGYGSLTITKPISIVNDGVGEASILVSGGAVGITVNAPPVSGYVNLRGITIQGISFGGGTGLRFNTGFSLTMENCVVRNHTGTGIDFLPNANSNLAVSNTLVADNGGSGINVFPTGSGTVKTAFNRVEAYNNSLSGIIVNGQLSTGTINATVEDSVAGGNAASGFRVFSGAASAAASLMVARSVAANNGAGISASGAKATLRVGQSAVTGNALSWQVTSSAVLRSYGDNNIDGNGDGDPAPTTIPAK